MPTITRDFIMDGRSDAGGWNREQLASIGITWNEARDHGWIDRNLGREITDDQAERFRALRGMTKRKARAMAIPATSNHAARLFLFRVYAFQPEEPGSPIRVADYSTGSPQEAIDRAGADVPPDLRPFLYTIPWLKPTR